MVCTVQFSTVTATVHFQRKTTQILPVERSFRSMENIFSVSSLLDCKNLYIITLNDQRCEKQKTWKAFINESLKLYKILSDIQGGGTMSLSIGDPRSVQFCLATRLQSISFIELIELVQIFSISYRVSQDLAIFSDAAVQIELKAKNSTFSVKQRLCSAEYLLCIPLV